VANSSNTVSVINGVTDAVKATIGVGSNPYSGPFAVAVDPLTDMVYVANVGSDTVSAIAPSTTVTWTASSSAITPTCEVLGASSSSGPWTEVTTAPCSSGSVTVDGPWSYWKVMSKLNDWEASSAPVEAS
jgi:YVTN family beta-propeller protein